MHAVLVNPNLVVQRSDPFTTGIVYLPVSLAYVAAALRASGAAVTVIDAFGEAPKAVRREGAFNVFGLTIDDVAARVPADASAVFVYAINLTNHISTIAIVRALKSRRPSLPLIVLENTQAVTAYALIEVADEFYAAGADFVVTGEGEHRSRQLLEALEAGADAVAIGAIEGVGTRAGHTPPGKPNSDLDALPFPAWDLFPLTNYWKLRHAHGPLTNARYLPLLTSRGCPYPCQFCVVPATNKMTWRPRSAVNVVDEIETHAAQFGLTEFHIEDLNPTISDTRIREICREIIRRRLNVTWKISAGTKVESIKNSETVDLMAKAGCRYISISPETGSPRLLKLVKKPFDLDHAVRIVTRMSEVGIRSQACFVLGLPGETAEDQALTRDLVRTLTKVGVDEIALFIVTPVPGSAFDHEWGGYDTLSDLNFSPVWRSDYRALNRYRVGLYARFLFWKLIHHPGRMLRQVANFMRRRFETKMEMVPYRALTVTWLGRRAR
jgi:anaerobic magnesium-protoporphyrin IX monomethyl ester cyclase